MKTYDNISLKEHNTFGIDVRARRMLVLEPGDVVPDIEGDVLLLGAGSDMLFTRDYDGTVLKLSAQADVSVEPDGADAALVQVTAWGGMPMDTLVQWTLDHGIYGLENLSAIPGTVGAAAVQNVGAYGVEAKDVVAGVDVYDMQRRQPCRLAAADCRFAYRDSLFKHSAGRYLVLRVVFSLGTTFRPNLGYKALEALPHATARQLRDSIVAMRWQKLPRPEEYGSAGSFFVNPVVDEATMRRLAAEYPDMPTPRPTPDGRYKLSAGWLIDRAGWKGRTQGRAGVWPHNALVLYNAGGCSGSEVLALAHAIQDDVAARFGVALVPEAIIV